MKKLYNILLVVFALFCLSTNANSKGSRPKLVVQVIVDGMRYDNFIRYSSNYSAEGFGVVASNGTQYRNARHENITTFPFVGVASIVTGATSSQHGITGQNIVNYTTNQIEDMFADFSCVGVGTIADRGAFSPKNIMVQTIGDRLKSVSDSSKVISIAHDYRNAIVAGGTNPNSVYWLDDMNMWWATNSYYANMLPKWCENFNRSEFIKVLINKGWNSQYDKGEYISHNSKYLFADNKKKSVFGMFKSTEVSYEAVYATPLIDDYLYEMARQTITNEKLGQDDYPDLLTLSFSGLSQINQKYGVNSLESEDALYNLDRILSDLNRLLTLKCGKENFVLLLTGSCGSSNEVVEGSRSKAGKFNKTQFKVMMNSFLATQFGVYDLILSYDKGNIYLNRKLIFEKKLSLNSVRETCSNFALQFRGVSQSYTADAIQNMSGSSGVQGRVVNSNYQKYAGDVVLVLLPNWIEVDIEDSDIISNYGSGYDYDVHVPLLFYGKNIGKNDIVREISIIDIAPTLSEILKIGRTDVSQGVALSEIVSVSIK